MLHVIKHCYNTSLWNSTRIIPPFPPFDEPNLCNGYIFMDPEYNDRLCFPNNFFLNTNLLDNVILQQVVTQTTKNPRSVSPHKSKSNTTTYKKKSYIKKKRNSGVQVHNYVEDLQNQIEMEQTYYTNIYSTQTKI